MSQLTVAVENENTTASEDSGHKVRSESSVESEPAQIDLPAEQVQPPETQAPDSKVF